MGARRTRPRSSNTARDADCPTSLGAQPSWEAQPWSLSTAASGRRQAPALARPPGPASRRWPTGRRAIASASSTGSFTARSRVRPPRGDSTTSQAAETAWAHSRDSRLPEAGTRSRDLEHRTSATSSPGSPRPASALDPLQLLHRPLVRDRARVDGALRLEEEDVDLLAGDGKVLDPVGNDRELSRLEHDLAVPQLDHQPALDDVEELVFGFVVVPHELAFELDRLDVEVVELADDLGRPVVGEELQLFRDVDFFDHGSKPPGQRSTRASLAAKRTSAPAMLRLIQVMTRGREITFSRSSAASNPYAAKTAKVRSMKTALRRSICGTGFASCGPRNWGRNAKKKRVSLGLRRLIRTALKMTRPAEPCELRALRSSAPCSRIIVQARYRR